MSEEYFRADDVAYFDLANQWISAAHQGYAHAVRFKRKRDGKDLFVLKAMLVPYIHEDSALKFAEAMLRQAEEEDALISVKRFHIDEIVTIEDLYPDEIEEDSSLVIHDAHYVILAMLLDNPDIGTSFGVFKRAWTAFGLPDHFFVVGLKNLAESGMISVVPPGFVWLRSSANEILGEGHEMYSFAEFTSGEEE